MSGSRRWLGAIALIAMLAAVILSIALAPSTAPGPLLDRARPTQHDSTPTGPSVQPHELDDEEAPPVRRADQTRQWSAALDADCGLPVQLTCGDTGCASYLEMPVSTFGSMQYTLRNPRIAATSAFIRVLGMPRESTPCGAAMSSGRDDMFLNRIPFMVQGRLGWQHVCVVDLDATGRIDEISAAAEAPLAACDVMAVGEPFADARQVEEIAMATEDLASGTVIEPGDVESIEVLVGVVKLITSGEHHPVRVDAAIGRRLRTSVPAGAALHAYILADF